MLIDEKISRWLSRRNARASRNEVKIAPWIAPSRACSWFWKQKIWLAICEFLFCDFSVNQFNFKFLHSISTFCTNFVFLYSKKFKFLHCLVLIDMLSANQHGEIFSCILLRRKQSAQERIKYDISYFLLSQPHSYFENEMAWHKAKTNTTIGFMGQFDSSTNTNALLVSDWESMRLLSIFESQRENRLKPKPKQIGLIAFNSQCLS